MGADTTGILLTISMSKGLIRVNQIRANGVTTGFTVYRKSMAVTAVQITTSE